MKIAVLGAGPVGSTLAKCWLDAGHDVVFAVRNPDSEKAQAAKAATGGKAELMAIPDAVAASEVVLLATQYHDAHNALGSAGDLSEKIIVDATNPLKPDLSDLTIGHETSAGEEIQKAFPGAIVVKAFNTTGFNIMADPKVGDQTAIMFVAGDDAGAKGKVLQLAEDCGFEALDAGPLAMARNLEPYALLWIKMAYVQGMGRDYAFVIARRKD
jgi:hypothetical protein